MLNLPGIPTVCVLGKVLSEFLIVGNVLWLGNYVITIS